VNRWAGSLRYGGNEADDKRNCGFTPGSISWRLENRYKVISFPADVRNHLQSRHDCMLAEKSVRVQGLWKTCGFDLRSAFKITKAVTSANASREATRNTQSMLCDRSGQGELTCRSIKPERHAVEIADGKAACDDAESNRRETLMPSPRNEIRDLTSFGILQDQMRANATNAQFSRFKGFGRQATQKTQGFLVPTWKKKTHGRVSRCRAVALGPPNAQVESQPSENPRIADP